MIHKSIKIIMLSNLELVSPLRVFIRNLLEVEEWNPENIDNVEIGFDETMTNVIRHTYLYSSEYNLELEILLTDKEIIIEIKDNGKPFNPTLIVIPSMEQQIKDPRNRVFGTTLIRKCIDKIEYLNSREFNNILRLTKYNARPIL